MGAVEHKAQQRNHTETMASLTRFCALHNVSTTFSILARSQVKLDFLRGRKAPLKVDQVGGLQKITSKLRMMILQEVFEPFLSLHAVFALWSQGDSRTFMKLITGPMELM